MFIKRSACIKSWYEKKLWRVAVSKTDSRVSENDCKKTGQNKTVKWNNENWFIEAKKPIAHSSPEAGLHRSQSTAAAPIWHSHTSSEPFPDSKLQHHSSSRREINLNIPATNFRRRAKPSGRSGCVACARVRLRALACAHHLLRSGWSETKHSTHSQHYEPDQQCFAHFFLLTRHISLSICLLCFSYLLIGGDAIILLAYKRWRFCA